ncbi:MAG: DUF1800 domain-containing protein [Ktedonobacterales bacterium]
MSREETHDVPQGGWDGNTGEPAPHPMVPPGYDDTPTRPLVSTYNNELTTAHGWDDSLPPITTLPPTSQRAPGAGQPERGLSRRVLLIGAGAVGVGAIGAGAGFFLTRGNQRAGIPNVFAQDAGKIGHLLRRAGFGLSPSDIGTYLDAGVQGSIDLLLNPASVPDNLDAQLKDMKFDFSAPQDLIRWYLLHMIYSKRPLQEKMTLFWHGVLTSSFRDVGGKKNYALLVQQNQTLREMGLARFDDLIRAISVDPAMLWYLDGRLSTGANANENYSRELMELFTLGITDANGNPNYTQDDVHQGALALSGWTIAGGKGVFVKKRAYHGSVTYLGHTGNLGLDDVVKIICAHPATGRHIAWRMWSFFVYENPRAGDLQPLVDAYYKHDHSISAMVRAMLTSPAFFGEKAYRARIKSPVELVVGAVRGLGLETDGMGLPALLQTMGQTPLDPPNVSGWDGDKVSAAWLSTQTWMARVNFINLLLAAASGGAVRIGKSSGNATPDKSVIQQLITSRSIGSANALADYAIAVLLDNTLADDRRTVLRETLAQTAPDNGSAFTLAGGAKVPTAHVRDMLYLLMSMPEYQMN